MPEVPRMIGCYRLQIKQFPTSVLWNSTLKDMRLGRNKPVEMGQYKQEILPAMVQTGSLG
jgi:hypothetical protein